MNTNSSTTAGAGLLLLGTVKRQQQKQKLVNNSMITVKRTISNSSIIASPSISSCRYSNSDNSNNSCNMRREYRHNIESVQQQQQYNFNHNYISSSRLHHPIQPVQIRRRSSLSLSTPACTRKYTNIIMSGSSANYSSSISSNRIIGSTSNPNSARHYSSSGSIMQRQIMTNSVNNVSNRNESINNSNVRKNYYSNFHQEEQQQSWGDYSYKSSTEDQNILLGILLGASIAAGIFAAASSSSKMNSNKEQSYNTATTAITNSNDPISSITPPPTIALSILTQFEQQNKQQKLQQQNQLLHSLQYDDHTMDIWNRNSTTARSVTSCDAAQYVDTGHEKLAIQDTDDNHDFSIDNYNGEDVLLSTTAATVTSSSSPTTGMKPRNVMLRRLQSVRGRSLVDKYNVDWDTVLGEGAYGSVHPARLKATGEKVALKKISRNYTSASGFKTETDALLRLYDNGGHPNVNGLRDMYEDHNYYYLILDLVSGGEMFEHLIQYGAYSETDSARLMHEIASALAFLHGVGIVHMDLKPENLLLSTKNRLDGTIKIIDFGGAYLTKDANIDAFDQVYESSVDTSGNDKGDGGSKTIPEYRLVRKSTQKFVPNTFGSTGTTAYWSPERFNRTTTMAGAAPGYDMWSVGVILYIMLTGVHPFDIQGCSTDEEIEERIIENPCPPLTPDLVGHLSDSAVDLIKKLMEKDPRKRLTAYHMLQHPWVRGETASKEKIQDSDKKLSQFQDIRHQLEAGMFTVLVSQGFRDATMSEGTETKGDLADSKHIMERAFAVLDADKKGFVTPDDFGRVAGVSIQSTKEYLKAAAQQVALPSGVGNNNGGDDTDVDGPEFLNLTQFQKLFSGLNHKHFPRGHYIFRAGDKGDAMYFLSSGKIEIQTRKGQLVAMLRSGDFFGEGSLLETEKHRFTSAKCATPVDVIEIKKGDFDRYMGSSPVAKRGIRVKWRARSLAYAKNLLRLQTNVVVNTFQKGDVIYKEDDIGTSMYRVDDDDGGELVASHNGTVVHKYKPGDSFGETSLLFKRPRSSTVTCATDKCKLHEMKGEDFLAVIESAPELAESLRNMARKRLFKKAVKAYSLERNRGFSDEDLVAAFHDADIDGSGSLNLDELRRIMQRMDPKFPMSEIIELMKFVDVDDDGQIKLDEFKLLFRQFDEAKEEIASTSTPPSPSSDTKNEADRNNYHR